MLLDAGDRYCPSCGKEAAEPLSCPACNDQVDATDLFCPLCGAKITAQSEKPVDPPFVLPGPKPECFACTHYRKRTFASDHLPHVSNAASVNQALMKVQEEERKFEAIEGEQKVLALKKNDARWLQRPRISAHCAVDAATNTFYICEIKNSDGTCADFAPVSTTPRPNVRCSGCAHLRPRDRNPYPTQGPESAELFMKLLEGVDSEIAREIVALFHRRGESAVPVRHHDYCVLHGRAQPYVNLHNDCADRIAGLGNSALFNRLRKKGKLAP